MRSCKFCYFFYDFFIMEIKKNAHDNDNFFSENDGEVVRL